jgi:hypothetical protein
MLLSLETSNKEMKTMFLITLLSFIFFNCENIEVSASAVIQGNVTIGPLCGTVPAGTEANRDNPCGLSDTEMNAIYGDYKVVLSPGNSQIKGASSEKILDKTGKFSFQIPSGQYRIQILRKDGSEVLPASEKNILSKTFSIAQNEVMEVSLHIEKNIK